MPLDTSSRMLKITVQSVTLEVLTAGYVGSKTSATFIDRAQHDPSCAPSKFHGDHWPAHSYPYSNDCTAIFSLQEQLPRPRRS
jgi:hypothetical protein